MGLLTVPLLAFLGALGATVLVLGISHIADATSADRLALAGVAVSFIIMAGANTLIILGDPRTMGPTYLSADHPFGMRYVAL